MVVSRIPHLQTGHHPIAKDVDAFLPPVPPNGWSHIYLDRRKADRPTRNLVDAKSRIYGVPVQDPRDMTKITPIIKKAIQAFSKQFGRNYQGLIETLTAATMQSSS